MSENNDTGFDKLAQYHLLHMIMKVNVDNVSRRISLNLS